MANHFADLGNGVKHLAEENTSFRASVRFDARFHAWTRYALAGLQPQQCCQRGVVCIVPSVQFDTNLCTRAASSCDFEVA